MYFLLIRVAALWNKKARLWIEGRKSQFSTLEQQVTASDRVIWVHCSSAGEFEQGKPIIEKLKEKFPGFKILVSFFSPSGYQVAGNYPYADFISYLPLDTKRNARKFLDLVHPELVIFIKYEFWYHHISEAAFRHIPVLLASAVFRKDQLFFKPYGRFYLQFLFLFRHLFVQDKKSYQILKEKGIDHCSISGDTRFDRVNQVTSQKPDLPVIAHFVNNEKALVAGSTWPDDEAMIAEAMKAINDCKLIIAPHEIANDHVANLQRIFPGALRYSMVKDLFVPEAGFKGIWTHINQEEKSVLRDKLSQSRILIIDNVGMLSRLYYFSTICYIGGGFTKDGIHNVLEPAGFGKPVIFGPNFHKYREAVEMIETGAAFSVSTAFQLAEIAGTLLSEPERSATAGAKALNYVKENCGASEAVVSYIQENRLLTN